MNQTLFSSVSKKHCQILIVGAGPAGMSAAKAAAESGQKVIMIDDNPVPGGQIWRDGANVTLPPLAVKYRQHLAALSNVEILSGSKIIAPGGSQSVIYENMSGCGEIYYQSLIICSGAREILLPFPGWTLPGVIGAGGLQAMIKGGLQLQNQRIVIAGSGPLLLAVATSVNQAGGNIAGLFEQTSWRALFSFAFTLWHWPTKFYQALTSFNSAYRANSYVLEALGDKQIEAVRIQQGTTEKIIPCDRLACGFGLEPNTDLGQLLGCRLESRALAVDERQQSSVENIYAAGECSGIGGGELSLVEGAIAGYSATQQYQRAEELIKQRQKWQHFANKIIQTFPLRDELKTLARPDTLICRCEDVPFSMLEPHTNWRQAKLNSRCGMGACQGKICATAAYHLLGWQTPPPRIPLSPVRVQSLTNEEK
ncbi:Rhodocoxin reductase [Pragia fontium]|uniref:NADPH-dependent 2,4-dienoyl-CoA reductase, sulfur reductase n=2 Tax=Pragia fontium TaxID=82985 RepID=A0AAJ4WDP1_9GAMM|nr:FAD/NAD(P)-binding oxidoreductase [Pragia fontium]AKJ43386.1 pyridine nucleotide-disulfide oxidoreductase [Pragia fontium]GKX64732.1 oxidoreductase [Pragia fontium]SFD45414.1 NADPH-dependent 2,4-dienoyl-CoA reductase, sulfur reductase [Pragia fontium DSM 5563 = ATCC 49100]SUB83860.1 Rhodocoxin reductase [Pragia fontium]